MKKIHVFYLATLSIIFSSICLQAQNQPAELKLYKDYLESHRNMSREDLEALHPAGEFDAAVKNAPGSALYLDSVSSKLSLTSDEKKLIQKNGFVVSERLQYYNFKSAFSSIYNKDLPLFISTDAILHALHMSYNELLTGAEVRYLIPSLQKLLEQLRGQMIELENKYSAIPKMKTSLLDFDLYTTVALKIFNKGYGPFYSRNTGKVDTIINSIEKLTPIDLPLFSNTAKTVDFSQFEPRGHYCNTLYPELQKYFKTMMWLAKADMWLATPKTLYPPQSKEDLQRQAILALIIAEAVSSQDNYQLYSGIDRFIEKFVGESDNVTLDNLQSLKKDAGITSPKELLDSNNFARFQDILKTKSYAYQRIMSQILSGGFGSPDSIAPPSAFALFGQRFTPDSYITGQVTFNRISYNGTSPRRMLPKPLDILYSLGNDASERLLKDDLEKYHYASNLAMLRYMMSSYSTEFWNSSLYLGWLNSIKTLNPPADRSALPPFMQTAAWWQEKMNTQLASWTELRHDNILYTKQSYSAGGCSYPYVYVEPLPEFYLAIKNMADIWQNTLKELNYPDPRPISYASVLRSYADTLYSVAKKELSRTNLNPEEAKFLKEIFAREGTICTFPSIAPSGWYNNLYYKSGLATEGEKEAVVADFHTAPTDENGLPAGWVLHTGTGFINTGVFVAPDNNGQNIAYAGPVMSYYEYLTTGFKRLTDNDWGYILSKSVPARPAFTNIYLADMSGNSSGDGISISTLVKHEKDGISIPSTFLTAGNYPNPFNPSTIIKFSVPYSLKNKPAELIIYDIQGKVVRHLLRETLQEGNYMIRWVANSDDGRGAASGVYLYRLTVGQNAVSGKMTFIK